MDVFADLWLGFATALSPTNLVYLVIGTMIGMIVGIIPGLAPQLASRSFCLSPSAWIPLAPS